MKPPRLLLLTGMLLLVSSSVNAQDASSSEVTPENGYPAGATTGNGGEDLVDAPCPKANPNCNSVAVKPATAPNPKGHFFGGIHFEITGSLGIGPFSGGYDPRLRVKGTLGKEDIAHAMTADNPGKALRPGLIFNAVVTIDPAVIGTSQDTRDNALASLKQSIDQEQVQQQSWINANVPGAVLSDSGFENAFYPIAQLWFGVNNPNQAPPSQSVLWSNFVSALTNNGAAYPNWNWNLIANLAPILAAIPGAASAQQIQAGIQTAVNTGLTTATSELNSALQAASAQESHIIDERTRWSNWNSATRQVMATGAYDRDGNIFIASVGKGPITPGTIVGPDNTTYGEMMKGYGSIAAHEIGSAYSSLQGSFEVYRQLTDDSSLAVKCYVYDAKSPWMNQAQGNANNLAMSAAAFKQESRLKMVDAGKCASFVASNHVHLQLSVGKTLGGLTYFTDNRFTLLHGRENLELTGGKDYHANQTTNTVTKEADSGFSVVNTFRIWKNVNAFDMYENTWYPSADVSTKPDSMYHLEKMDLGFTGKFHIKGIDLMANVGASHIQKNNSTAPGSGTGWHPEITIGGSFRKDVPKDPDQKPVLPPQ